MRATLIAATAFAVLAAGLPAAAFDPTGEIIFRVLGGQSAGAAFDDQQVVGPSVNMALGDDGSWSGDVAGEDVALSVTPAKISGVNVNIVLSNKNGASSMEGLFFGRRVRIEMDAKKLHGRLGACSFDLQRKSPAASFTGDVGCMGQSGAVPLTGKASVVLTGDAAHTPPQQPQFLLGLLAILPG